MITHTWITANPLNPYIDMHSHKKNPKENLRDAFQILYRKPLYFYLSPFGYQWCITSLFTLYVAWVLAWSWTHSDQTHTLHELPYAQTIDWFESVLWFMNLGFIYTEWQQFYSLGRAYFSVSGGTNLWDILMSLLWAVLLAIRCSFLLGYVDDTPLYVPPLSSFSRRRRRLASTSTSPTPYCPPDFFSCTLHYDDGNESCEAQVASADQEVLSVQCGADRRRLQDSNVDVITDNVAQDNFYDSEDDALFESSTTNSSTGLKCVTVNRTIFEDTVVSLSSATDGVSVDMPMTFFWNESCLNFDENVSLSNASAAGCVVSVQMCEQTFDRTLLLTYNVLWAMQLTMLTIRLLLYYESVGGFFGILLRIIKSMTIEVLKFGIIILTVVLGFFFAIWFLFSSDVARDGTITDVYDCVIFFFKLLFGGGNVGTIDNDYQNYRVFAQLIIMVFAILGVRMFMSLLIALMSGAMNRVRAQAKAETSFTSAQYAYELSNSPRPLPMPLNLVATLVSLALHVLNLPLALASPSRLNLYAYVNQRRLHGLQLGRRRSRRRPIEIHNHMNTRRRVLQYYCSWAVRGGKGGDWHIYHVGCYNAITGIYGTEQLQTVSMNQYYSILETKRKVSEENRKLNVHDKLFLKHLTLKTQFCQHCFRPIALDDIRSNLITPFDALVNVVSCYLFLLLWPLYTPMMWLMCQVERAIQIWEEEWRAHSPKMLKCDDREYDLEYFPRSAVKPLSVRRKSKKDFRKLGTGGPDVTDVDVNYDELDDAGAE